MAPLYCDEGKDLAKARNSHFATRYKRDGEADALRCVTQRSGS